jgi:E3 ubiquitin-protein ligase SHPRH
LEPVLDPGAEAQAMKRVDRIGQTAPTCVHRFLLQGTVEENVQELSRRRKEAAPGEATDVGRVRSGPGLRISEVEVLIPKPVAVGSGSPGAARDPGTETVVQTD